MANNPKADSNEETILESYDRDEWSSVSKLQNEMGRYQEYASAWLEANRLVSLTLPASDFEKLKKKAGEAGIPYQVLVANLVRQFVAGQIHASSPQSPA